MTVFKAYGITLEKIQREHLELIRVWRNHPDVRKYMFHQAFIERQQHSQWFEQHYQKNQLHLVGYFRSQPIACCNLKAPKETSLALHKQPLSGFYMAPDAFRQSMLAFLPALAFHSFAFERLECTSLEAEVLIDNQAAIRFNQALGYTLEETTQDARSVHMQLLPDAHRQACWRFRRFAKDDV